MKRSELIKIIKEELDNVQAAGSEAFTDRSAYVSWQELAKKAIKMRQFKKAFAQAKRAGKILPFLPTSGALGVILTKWSAFNKIVGAIINYERDPQSGFAHRGKYKIDPDTPVDPDFVSHISMNRLKNISVWMVLMCHWHSKIILLN